MTALVELLELYARAHVGRLEYLNCYRSEFGILIFFLFTNSSMDLTPHFCLFFIHFLPKRQLKNTGFHYSNKTCLDVLTSIVECLNVNKLFRTLSSSCIGVISWSLKSFFIDVSGFVILPHFCNCNGQKLVYSILSSHDLVHIKDQYEPNMT